MQGRSAIAALRIREFRWYWFSGLGLTGAQSIQMLAMSWLILDLTGSIGRLGLMNLMLGVPMSIASLWGGVLIDRVDRMRLMAVSQAGPAVITATLALLAVTGAAQEWHVYLAATGLGAMQGLNIPTRNAVIDQLVDRDNIQNAIGLNTLQIQMSAVVFPPLAGSMIALFDVGGSLVASALGAAASVAFLRMIKVALKSRGEAGRTRLEQLPAFMEGLHYTLTAPKVGTLMSMAFCVGFFGLAYLSLAPGYAREELGLNSSQVGLFLMSLGLGSLVGNLFMLRLTFQDYLRLYFLGAAGLGVNLILIALSPSPLIAVLPSAAFGFCLSGMIISGLTLLQTKVPGHLLGRANGVWMLVGGIGFVAALPIGYIGEALGPRLALGGAGVLLLACVFLNGFVRTPTLRLQRRGRPELP